MKLDRCLNLHTEWRAFGDGVNTEKEKRRYSACYGSNFPNFHGNQKYEIWMYHSGDGFKAGCRTDTFLGKEEIVNHVEYIRDLLPSGTVTDIRVEDDNDERARKYKLSLQVHGENIYHKLVLNWIRYAYELPYSLILKDVLRMEEKGDFKELGRLNKFILVSSAWTSYSEYYWREDMSFGHYTNLMTEKRLLERLREESENDEQYLENVFGERHFIRDKVMSLPDDDLLETDNWIEGNNYGNRIEYYKTNYNIYNKSYEQEKTT